MKKTQIEIETEIDALQVAQLASPQFTEEIQAAIDALDGSESYAQVDGEEPRTDEGDKAAGAATQAIAWANGEEQEAFSVTIANRLKAQ